MRGFASMTYRFIWFTSFHKILCQINLFYAILINKYIIQQSIIYLSRYYLFFCIFFYNFYIVITHLNCLHHYCHLGINLCIGYLSYLNNFNYHNLLMDNHIMDYSIDYYHQNHNLNFFIVRFSYHIIVFRYTWLLIMATLQFYHLWKLSFFQWYNINLS